MDDEIWTMKDGRRVAVGDMSEDHVRNALRMLLRNRRRVREAVRDAIRVAGAEVGWDGQDGPNNHAHLAQLYRVHGDVVRTERSSMGGMGGSNVYVGDRPYGSSRPSSW